MTPGEILHTLQTIQARLKSLESVLNDQREADPRYIEITHELVEASDALERAMDTTHELALGAN